ncbi:RNA polymerase sigma factor [Clostridium tunisiense]|uniref:RNA polymerase sigma factor n=1 Tax=Clostridium tunisiense TaxID=219748 RepID=UPI0003117DB3|nr:sigma-70 family RNA polymerase sigma factor [Clostridium tunisiense]
MKEFDELYNLYSEGVYKYLVYLTGNLSVAEDLLQETFFQAFKSINKFKGESKISTWLYGIARNTYLKNYNREKKYNLCHIDDFKDHINSGELLDSNYERKETLREILCEINKLDFESKQVVLLRISGDLSFKDIGEILGKSESWARVTFHRTKIKLRKEMEL